MRQTRKSFHRLRQLYVSVFSSRYLPKRILLISLLMGCFSFSGCASAVQYSPAYKGDSVPDGRAIVYGKLIQSSDSDSLNSCSILFRKKLSNQASGYVKIKGEFYLLLTMGDYIFFDLTCQHGTYTHSWHLNWDFSVPDSSKAVYIGDITLKRNGGYLGKEVFDNYSASTTLLKDRYPNLLSNNTEKNLVLFKPNDM